MVAYAAALALLMATPSHDALSASNGFGAMVVDAETGALEALWTHAYAEASAGVVTPNVCFDSYGGVAVDGGPAIWLGKQPADLTAYSALAPGIVSATHGHDSVTVTTMHFMPWSLARPGVVSIYQVTNTDTVPRSVSMAALANYHLGPEGTAAAESIEVTGAGAMTEGGVQTPHRMVYRAWPTPTAQAVSPVNAYERWLERGALPAVEAPSGSAAILDDAVVGFSWAPVELQPSETTHFGLLAAYGTAVEGDGLAAEVDAWLDGRSFLTLSTEMQAEWASSMENDTWQTQLEAMGRPPSESLLAVWRQGVEVMRMSQVREVNVEGRWPHGQILASLPPGMWNRAWPRDGAYAIAGLSRTGYLEEAWSALRFMLDSPGGTYTDAVGGDYLVSVCRYYGGGTEESDVNAHGPNIEYDGFGLFLWALSTWVDHGGDLDRLAPYWPDIQARVLEPLLGLISPTNGLILPDSGIWEVHWDGQEKQFTHTSAAAAAGLCGAARLATALGEPAAATTYAEAAEGIRHAVLTHLVDPTTVGLAGNVEEMASGQALDAAAVEALNWGLVQPSDPVYGATLEAFEALRISPERGYARNDDGGWYDTQEWVFVDLRIAAARALAGDQPEADRLIAWVVEQSVANFNLIAELYTVEDAAYEGAIPMAGYGGGALALATLGARPMMDAAGCILPTEEPPTDTHQEPDATTAPTHDSGPTLPDTEAPLETTQQVAEGEDTTPPSRDSKGCTGGEPTLPLGGLILLMAAARLRRRKPGH